MEALKARIKKDGTVKSDVVLKVDSFLNHQVDPLLMMEIGKEFKRIFDGTGITKVLTIEASGIAIAAFTAYCFGVPAVYAKKTLKKPEQEKAGGSKQPINLDGDMYITEVESFTHKRTYDIIVSKKFLSADDKVLIVDDFLANGRALLGLCNLVKQSNATLVGAGIVIEKGFQHGGDDTRNSGVKVVSLANIDSMSVDGGVIFRD